MKDLDKIKLSIYDFERNKLRNSKSAKADNDRDVTYINNVTVLSQKNKLSNLCVTSKEYKYLEQKEKL